MRQLARARGSKREVEKIRKRYRKLESGRERARGREDIWNLELFRQLDDSISTTLPVYTQLFTVYPQLFRTYRAIP